MSGSSRKPQVEKTPPFALGAAGAVMLPLFFITGACGLIYEVVWTRLLRLVMGNTTYTITTVLAAFMGGLALGSYLGGRLAERRRDPLRMFAVIQAAIAAYCFVLPWLIGATQPVYRLLYRNVQAWPEALIAARFALCGMLLVVPAALMGATLPVLSRFFVRSGERVGTSVGTLYAVNTFGAVAGALAAGFVLVPSLGVSTTIHVACGLSLLAAAVSYALSRRAAMPADVSAKDKSGAESPPAGAPGANPPAVIAAILIGYAFAGGAAMLYEIAWTRVISLLVGSTVYAFSMMLTAFILGLALGSAAAARFADRLRRPLRTLAIVEVLVGLSSLLVLPFIDRLPFHVTGWLLQVAESFWRLQFLQFGLMLGIMLVPTVLMGAAFPLVNRLVAAGRKGVARSVGTVYCWNTLGCILGSTIGGFALIPWLGLQRTLFAAAGINVAVGGAFLLLARPVPLARRVVAAAVSVALAAGAIAWMPAWDPSHMSFGPFMVARRNASLAQNIEAMESAAEATTIRYHKEGLVTTVTVMQRNGHRFLVVNGKPDASSDGDLPTQELLAHVPMLLHPRPRSVLVIGLGSGITLGSTGLYDAETLDCVEISPAVLEACRYFDKWNYRILDDPRVNVIIADGRNHIALTDRKYDVIISEPSNPWVAGVADLFTLEFYRACRDRLNDGGILCAFLEAYNIDGPSFRSVLRTFQSVFPNATLWCPDGYDYFLVGSVGEVSVDHKVLAARMLRPTVASDLRRVGVNRPSELFAVQIMDARAVGRFAGGAPIHTDDNALLEFSTPRIVLANPEDYTLGEAIERNRHVDLAFLTGADAKVLAQLKERTTKVHAARGHVFLGSALSDQGKLDQAIQHYRKALEIDPECVDAHYNLGVALGQQRKFDQAIEHYRKALEINPEHADAHCDLGAALGKLGKLDQAIEHYRKALEIDPEDAGAHYDLGGALAKQGKLDQAIEHYRKILEINPEYADVHNNLGVALGKQGKFDQAIEHCRKALEINPKYASAHNNLGGVLYKLGKLDQAIEHYRKAIEIDPTLHSARINLDRALQKQKKSKATGQKER